MHQKYGSGSSEKNNISLDINTYDDTRAGLLSEENNNKTGSFLPRLDAS